MDEDIVILLYFIILLSAGIVLAGLLVLLTV